MQQPTDEPVDGSRRMLVIDCPILVEDGFAGVYRCVVRLIVDDKQGKGMNPPPNPGQGIVPCMVELVGRNGHIGNVLLDPLQQPDQHRLVFLDDE